jgi:hypothetical protein
VPKSILTTKNSLFFTLRHDTDELTEGLVAHVEDSMNEYGIYQPISEAYDELDDLYLVEDLAVVQADIMRVAYDIPNYPRVIESNPEVAIDLYQFPYITIDDDGVEAEEIHFGAAGVHRLGGPRDHRPEAQRLVEEIYGV